MKTKLCDLSAALLEIRGTKPLREIAEFIGCSIGQVGYMEDGSRQPSLNMLQKYADLHGKNLTIVIEPSEGSR